MPPLDVLSTKACVLLPLVVIPFSLDIWCRTEDSDPIKRGRNWKTFLNMTEIHSQNEFLFPKHLHFDYKKKKTCSCLNGLRIV